MGGECGDREIKLSSLLISEGRVPKRKVELRSLFVRKEVRQRGQDAER